MLTGTSKPSHYRPAPDIIEGGARPLVEAINSIQLGIPAAASIATHSQPHVGAEVCDRAIRRASAGLSMLHACDVLQPRASRGNDNAVENCRIGARFLSPARLHLERAYRSRVTDSIPRPNG